MRKNAQEWSISDAVVAAIEGAIAQFSTDYAPPDFAYYPLVNWREGGWAQKGDGPRMSLEDHYDLGLIKQEEVATGNNWLPIANKRFGFVVFVPRDADAASTRRLIDYDGEQIVVR